jgi:hypothetical protein
MEVKIDWKRQFASWVSIASFSIVRPKPAGSSRSDVRVRRPAGPPTRRLVDPPLRRRVGLLSLHVRVSDATYTSKIKYSIKIQTRRLTSGW